MNQPANCYPERVSAKATTPPFQPDFMKRKPIAEKLTNYINYLKKGHTIAIDAQWGDGKTWFGLNWQAELNNQGHKTLWLDAFASDHADDPFLAIMEQMVKLQPDGFGKGRIITTATKVGKQLLPAIGKAVTAAAITYGIGFNPSETIKAATNNVDEAIEEGIRRRLASGEENSKAINKLRGTLAKYALSDKGKPLVFFVDELDRCKPDYALKLIERIKHFFEIENVIFILLMNRNAMESTIKGIYGEKFDATYLDKFLDLSLTLPGFPTDAAALSQIVPAYIQKIKNDMGLSAPNMEEFCMSITLAIPAFNLSLRNIQRCLLLFQLSQPPILTPLAAWLIAMKVGNSALFDGVKSGEKSAIQKAEQLAIDAKKGGSGWATYIRAAHLSQYSNNLPLDEQNIFNQVNQRLLFDRSFSSDDIVRFMINQIDLPEMS